MIFWFQMKTLTERILNMFLHVFLGPHSASFRAFTPKFGQKFWFWLIMSGLWLQQLVLCIHCLAMLLLFSHSHSGTEAQSRIHLFTVLDQWIQFKFHFSLLTVIEGGGALAWEFEKFQTNLIWGGKVGWNFLRK